MSRRAAWQARMRAAARSLRPGVPQLFPPGAFYSPVVDAALVTSDPERTRLWPSEPPDPPGIDVRGMAGIELRVEKVEHTPPEVFASLAAGDVLFVDSSHVAKTGSDVVHLIL